MQLPFESIKQVASFEELITTDFAYSMNAICWERMLDGDFAEIVNKLTYIENTIQIDEEQLRQLLLSPNGQLARKTLLEDFQQLKAIGASPELNVLIDYERDEDYAVFPKDVYSFHVDRSPVPVATFLCTYYGDSSEIVSNSEAVQKIILPEIRSELRKLYKGTEEGFDAFLIENFYDLHYQANQNAKIIQFGTGNLWKIAVDHPTMKVAPCIHRAPQEKSGLKRLLLIC
ncbi:MAG: hypothetical protein RIT10_1733 [Bacteroidota bacterium]|jgi:hypothetical protein